MDHCCSHTGYDPKLIKVKKKKRLVLLTLMGFGSGLKMHNTWNILSRICKRSTYRFHCCTMNFIQNISNVLLCPKPTTTFSKTLKKQCLSTFSVKSVEWPVSTKQGIKIYLSLTDSDWFLLPLGTLFVSVKNISAWQILIFNREEKRQN